MNAHSVFMISGVVVGILYVVLGIPLALRWISPNKIYGMRTTKTLSDPAIWYRANAFAGKWMVVAGMVTLFSVLLVPLAPATWNTRITSLGFIALVFEVAPIIAVAVASAVFVQKL